MDEQLVKMGLGGCSWGGSESKVWTAVYGLKEDKGAAGAAASGMTG